MVLTKLFSCKDGAFFDEILLTDLSKRFLFFSEHASVILLSTFFKASFMYNQGTSWYNILTTKLLFAIHLS